MAAKGYRLVDEACNVRTLRVADYDLNVQERQVGIRMPMPIPSDEPTAPALKCLPSEKFMQREKRKLRTQEDLRLALEYAEKVQRHFAEPTKSFLEPLIGRRDELMQVVRSDAQVKRAVQQIELWRNTAAVFLLRQQAQDALDCYQLALAESLTRVNDLNITK